MNEILRIRPPVPRTIKPVLLSEDLDEPKFEKKVTYKYVKHLFNDAKEYQKSIVSVESYHPTSAFRSISKQRTIFSTQSKQK